MKILPLTSVSLLLIGLCTNVYASQWAFSGHQGNDWAATDYACSKGSTPDDNLCNSKFANLVAICWQNNDNTGYPDIPGSDCKGEANWCVYKRNVNLNGEAGGAKNGKVYFCGQ